MQKAVCSNCLLLTAYCILEVALLAEEIGQ